MTEYQDMLRSVSEDTLLAVMQVADRGQTVSVKNIAKMVLKDESVVHCIPTMPALDDIEDIVVAAAERWGFAVVPQDGERVVVRVGDW